MVEMAGISPASKQCFNFGVPLENIFKILRKMVKDVQKNSSAITDQEVKNVTMTNVFQVPWLTLVIRYGTSRDQRHVTV